MNKLDGFAPVYVINLENRQDRRKYIESELKINDIKDYTIIDAIYGEAEDFSKTVYLPQITNLTKAELGCTLSHLKAIETWLKNSKSEYAIIIEDDLSFETLPYWNQTFQEFLDSLSEVDYDVLQLAVINDKMNLFFHKRDEVDWSAACYLIKRSYAERLIDMYKPDDKYYFGQNNNRSVADALVYINTDKAYTYPLFTYRVDLNSSIHPGHVDSIHVDSRNIVLDFWKIKKSLDQSLNNY